MLTAEVKQEIEVFQRAKYTGGVAAEVYYRHVGALLAEVEGLERERDNVRAEAARLQGAVDEWKDVAGKLTAERDASRTACTTLGKSNDSLRAEVKDREATLRAQQLAHSADRAFWEQDNRG